MLIADRYEIDDLPVGRGGMGAVHHGLDTHLGRRVAVKFLHLPGGSEEQRERFVREVPGPLPGAPPELERVVLDLLAKDPADRPADAAALHDRLAPLAVDLPPLPGFLTGDQGPGRRYACVWGRTA